LKREEEERYPIGDVLTSVGISLENSNEARDTVLKTLFFRCFEVNFLSVSLKCFKAIAREGVFYFTSVFVRRFFIDTEVNQKGA
jgi:hypothetical protein